MLVMKHYVHLCNIFGIFFVYIHIQYRVYSIAYWQKFPDPALFLFLLHKLDLSNNFW